MTRLPTDFEFPKAGVYDVWIKWNIEDSERKIPPLRMLKSHDYSFLDKKEKTAAEKRGSTGLHKDKRRPTRKTYSDIKFLCEFIQKIATDSGMDATDRGFTNVQLMYETASPTLFEKIKDSKRATQYKWQTVVARLRKINAAANKVARGEG